LNDARALARALAYDLARETYLLAIPETALASKPRAAQASR
jgi:hypothetical protein